MRNLKIERFYSTHSVARILYDVFQPTTRGRHVHPDYGLVFTFRFKCSLSGLLQSALLSNEVRHPSFCTGRKPYGKIGIKAQALT